MRKRTKDLHLPTGVYFSHGKYYKVVKGKWINLGPDLKRAIELCDISSPAEANKDKISAWADVCYSRAKINAKGRRKIQFDLTRDDVKELLVDCGWKCAVTGVMFTYEIISGKKPFAPSIDRIDSSKGYTKDNCRIVCVAANYAMNVWGDQVLIRMLEGMMGKAFGTIRNPKVLGSP